MPKNKLPTQTQGAHKMREFHSMVKKLHEMLQSLGQQSVGDTLIKLDEFEKLRRAFTSAAQTYETCNNQIKAMSDRVMRAELMFSILESKRTMKDTLKQMTTITYKLKQKMSKRDQNKFKTPQKRKNKWQIEDQFGVSDQVLPSQQDSAQQKSPQEKQLEYKTLVLYNLQKVFYQLVENEKSQVASIRKDIVKNKFAGLQEMKKQAQNRKLMGQFENQELTRQEQLKQEQILEAIRKLDDQIQAKMVPILEGIEKMQSHAIGISNSIGNVHKMILVNLELTEKNTMKLGEAQKMLDKVAPHARKASCICNVVLFFLLALAAFLILKLFGAFGEENVTPK